MILAATLFLIPAQVHAAISGHADLVNTGFGAWTGTVNYAVLDMSVAGDAAMYSTIAGSGGSFTPGTGSATLSGAPSGFVYLYQPTNDPTSSVALSHFTNNLGFPGNNAPISPAFWGQYVGVAMADGGGVISPANDMDAISGFVPAAGLANAVEIVLGPTGSPSSFIAHWADSSGGPHLPAGATSGLFVFTSPYAPGPFFTSMQDGGGAATGISVAPFPEPASLSLLAIGALALRRRRRD